MVTETELETRAFTRAVRKLFILASKETCAKYGDLSQFMYASPSSEIEDDWVNGGEGFNALLHHPDYYLLNKGKNLILNKRYEIADALGELPTYYRDLGPGPRASVEGKTIPFIMAKMRAAGGAHGVRGVILVDRNREYLTDGQDAIHDIYPKMPITIVNDTFDRIAESQEVFGKVTSTLLGNTGGNFEYNPAVPNPFSLRFFEDIRALSESTGGMVVIEQDCTQDQEKLLAAYFNEAASDWMKNLLHRMVRDAGVKFEKLDSEGKVITEEGTRGGLDKQVTGFEYFARWNKETFCMEMGVKAKHNYNVRMNGDSFEIKAGTELHMWNSHKYPPELFQHMLDMAGFKRGTIITDAGPGRPNSEAQSALHFVHVEKLAA